MQVKNIVVGQKYTTKTGEEKTKWTTIGAAFIKDDGKMSIKIEQIPLNWDGQAQIFDRENRQNNQPQQGYQPQAPQQQYQNQAPQQNQQGSFPQQPDITEKVPF